MATGDQRASRPAPGAGAGLRIGVVRASWNAEIVDRLAAGAERGLAETGATKACEAVVPGCFEIPLAAKLLAASGRLDAVVTLGAVIRGETTHYELVSEGAASGVMEAQLATGVPIALGLATVENHAQALERSQDAGGHNVGEEAVHVAVAMALLVRDLRSGEAG